MPQNALIRNNFGIADCETLRYTSRTKQSKTLRSPTQGFTGSLITHSIPPLTDLKELIDSTDSTD